jgi:hypothetical protein
MEFHVFHDLMLHEESIVYSLMGVIVLAALGWWIFLTGKEPKDNNHH